jgi:hypothetical protein
MRFFKIFLLLSVLVFAHLVFSQGRRSGEPPSGASTSSQELTIPDVRFTTGSSEEIDKEMNILAGQLKLTEDQKKKARIIIESRQKQVLEVREVLFPVSKPGESPGHGGSEAMDKVLKESHAKMLTILNEEQKKKYDEIDPNIKAPVMK